MSRLSTFDRRQGLGDAVDEGLAADEPDVGMSLRLGDQMLAAAEADLEPKLARLERKQRRSGFERRRIDLKRRQALGDQARMMRAQRLALAAPVKGAARLRFADAVPATALTRAQRSWSARSVFSQEKPPSASGSRPKWP